MWLARGQLKVPEQKFFVGDLVIVMKDEWPYLSEGDVGLITYADCRKVCVKGGISHLRPEEGGPRYRMEWCYVGDFSNVDMPRGTRLSRLSPVRVVQDEIQL